MDWNLVGQACALAAAINWAGALVLFKFSGEHVAPMPLNLFKNTLALVLFAVTLLALGQGPGVLSALSAGEVWILVFRGVLGIAVADTILVYSLNLVGLGFGPFLIGLLNDAFADRFGIEAIRYSLLFVGLAGLPGSLFFLTASHTLREDLDARDD